MPILDLIFPKTCLSCKRERVYLCEECIKNVKPAGNICFYCRKPSIDGMTHEKCRKKLGLERFISVWMYRGVVRIAILKLKYNFSYDITSELAEASHRFIKTFDKQLPKNSVLVPIPLHTKRERWRGFNQSEVLGREISLKLGLDYLPDLLVRKSFSIPQTLLKGESRKKNIRGAFSLSETYKTMNPKKEILVFDDVSTTGSTVKEAVKTIKRRGFEKVSVLTLART